ncbi:peptidylprolyl isomerase [Flaviaesturariibacter amylovorans]|uniref:Peptidylprolyl isomerase n=1 Tax=Flaviaesturariibacter amylovorans TaxID=1084520 RepID=A0ABP8HUL3_9BACT
MLKRILSGAAFLFLASVASAQTLFTYGRDTVTVPDFLAAYKKNNAGKGTTSLNDYLDLYITSRLKVREARRLGYDTLPNMVADLQNLREQLLPTYLNDLAGVDGLVQEAFERSKKNIRLAHIFIAEKGDAAAAALKMQQAVSELGSGKPFADVARRYSEDPSVKDNGGELGWIAVFTLPYTLENLAYNTRPGALSAVQRSKAGYHLFKNIAERPDPGTLKAAQILLAFPPGATEADKAALKKRADSLHARLLKGADFATLATKFSNDVVSANNKGELQDLTAGQYDPVFERQVFALAKDGALTAPFLTEHGWHIVKRRSLVPRPATATPEVLQALRASVEASDRIATVRGVLAQKIGAQVGSTPHSFNNEHLFLYSDSLLEYKKPGIALSITETTPLLRVGDQAFTTADWLKYIGANRFKADGSGAKPYPQLWDEFREASAIEYYKNHLEQFNATFRGQMEEFRDGNLFFEIMQRQVWGPAQNDTAALEAYYNAHRSSYQWTDPVDAVIFYAPDLATARAAHTQIAKKPAAWATVLATYDDKIAVDSNRFDRGAIPNGAKTALKAGTVTAPLVNASDNSAAFALILKEHPGTAPRSFAEARGLVIADYQKELEAKWINELRARYPVTINQPVLLELMKGK